MRKYILIFIVLTHSVGVLGSKKTPNLRLQSEGEDKAAKQEELMHEHLASLLSLLDDSNFDLKDVASVLQEMEELNCVEYRSISGRLYALKTTPKNYGDVRITPYVVGKLRKKLRKAPEVEKLSGGEWLKEFLSIPFNTYDMNDMAERVISTTTESITEGARRTANTAETIKSKLGEASKTAGEAIMGTGETISKIEWSNLFTALGSPMKYASRLWFKEEKTTWTRRIWKLLTAEDDFADEMGKAREAMREFLEDLATTQSRNLVGVLLVSIGVLWLVDKITGKLASTALMGAITCWCLGTVLILPMLTIVAIKCLKDHTPSTRLTAIMIIGLVTIYLWDQRENLSLDASTMATVIFITTFIAYYKVAERAAKANHSASKDLGNTLIICAGLALIAIALFNWTLVSQYYHCAQVWGVEKAKDECLNDWLSSVSRGRKSSETYREGSTVLSLIAQMTVGIIIILPSVILSAAGRTISKGTFRAITTWKKGVNEKTGGIGLADLVAFLGEPTSWGMLIIAGVRAYYKPVESLAYVALTALSLGAAAFTYKFVFESEYKEMGESIALMAEQMLNKEEAVMIGSRPKGRNFATLSIIMYSVSAASILGIFLAQGATPLMIVGVMIIGATAMFFQRINNAYNAAIIAYAIIIFMGPGYYNKALAFIFVIVSTCGPSFNQIKRTDEIKIQEMHREIERV